MLGRRATAVACVVAPLSYLVAQVLIASMEDTGTTLERVAASGSAWTSSHLLLALAAATYVLVAVGLATLTPRSNMATVGLVLVVVGAIVQASLVGVDLALGALADAPDPATAATTHRDIVEDVVVPLDRLSLLPTAGLSLLAVTLLLGRALPAPVAGALLVALAVPGLSSLRVVAAALLLAAFVAVAVALWRPAPRNPVPLAAWAPWAACLPFAAVAWVSVPRAGLLVAVVIAVLMLRSRVPQNATERVVRHTTR